MEEVILHITKLKQSYHLKKGGKHETFYHLDIPTKKVEEAGLPKDLKVWVVFGPCYMNENSNP